MCQAPPLRATDHWSMKTERYLPRRVLSFCNLGIAFLSLALNSDRHTANTNTPPDALRSFSSPILSAHEARSSQLNSDPNDLIGKSGVAHTYPLDCTYFQSKYFADPKLNEGVREYNRQLEATKIASNLDFSRRLYTCVSRQYFSLPPKSFEITPQALNTWSRIVEKAYDAMGVTQRQGNIKVVLKYFDDSSEFFAVLGMTQCDTGEIDINANLNDIKMEMARYPQDPTVIGPVWIATLSHEGDESLGMNCHLYFPQIDVGISGTDTHLWNDKTAQAEGLNMFGAILNDVPDSIYPFLALLKDISNRTFLVNAYEANWKIGQVIAVMRDAQEDEATIHETMRLWNEMTTNGFLGYVADGEWNVYGRAAEAALLQAVLDTNNNNAILYEYSNKSKQDEELPMSLEGVVSAFPEIQSDINELRAIKLSSLH